MKKVNFMSTILPRAGAGAGAGAGDVKLVSADIFQKDLYNYLSIKSCITFSSSKSPMTMFF
jgi:hypothetical protein